MIEDKYICLCGSYFVEECHSRDHYLYCDSCRSWFDIICHEQPKAKFRINKNVYLITEVESKTNITNVKNSLNINFDCLFSLDQMKEIILKIENNLVFE